jgi:uncharacterized membrane protein
MRPMRVRGEAYGEYLRGALWALPGAAVVVAFAAGATLSQIRIGPGSPLYPLVFAGTAEDARQLLVAIASTMVTVIALVLGLTIVALQISSTQFSPRLLRNFLRDRPTQFVLATFVATFTYSTAGLYTVGVASGTRAEDFPRLAVTGAIALVFVSLGMLVYFAHHIAHAIQIDAVMTSVARATAHGVTIRAPATTGTDRTAPVPPAGAIELPAPRSGYLQTVHPERLVDATARQDAVISIVPWPGAHVVAGAEVLALAWSAGGGPPKDPGALAHALHGAVQIGTERTLQHDSAFGLRQLVDMALKALSPAINDPYTAVQALDRLSTLISLLGARTLGADIRQDHTGTDRAIADGPAFADYLDLACGQIRRYGSAEPAVCQALLRLLEVAATVVTDPDRRAAAADHVRLVLLAAEFRIAQDADLEPVRALGTKVLAATHV